MNPNRDYYIYSSINMSSSHRDERSNSIIGADDAADHLDESNQRRSERKRMREKQRRSDLSNAFEELSQFLAQVEPQQGMEEETASPGGSDKRKRRKSIDGAEDSGGITRLDLIGRAVRYMKRLHRENEERKRIIASYEAHGHPPSDNVLVMVPSLAPVDDQQQPVARASYPPTAYQHAYPHHATAASSLQHYPPLATASGASVAVDPRLGYDPNAAAHHQQQHAASAAYLGYGRPQYPVPPGTLVHPHAPPHPHYMHSPHTQHHTLPRTGVSPTPSGLSPPAPAPPPPPGGHQ